MKPRHLVTIAALACLVWSMTSCTVHLGADGSKTATVDGAGAAAAIFTAGKILAEK